MFLFSQRKGLKPIKTNIQLNSIDDDLRNGLWNVLYLFYWKGTPYNMDGEMKFLVQMLWHHYFKKPLDTLPNFDRDIYEEIRNYFFNCEWYEVYDFIEFVVNNYQDDKVNQKVINACNFVLERELSAYRFVGDKITQITSKEEILEIEEALVKTEPLKGVHIHLKSALEKLSNKKSPDYRNSIKESISAVESICKLITGMKKATLGEALKKIEEKIGLHPALKSAFSSLYGYTSDEEGIRHALLDEANLGYEEAKFMLVSCSAFINYLISKAEKGGIKIRSIKL